MNVISFSLFGTRQFNFEVVFKSAWTFFPGWEVRVHYESGLLARAPVLEKLAKRGLIMLQDSGPSEHPCKSMLWRVKPLWDRSVDHFICRDLDSILMLKDRRMVETFMETGAAVHCVNDHPDHFVPMMGGMVGFNNREFWAEEFYRSWNDFVHDYPYWDFPGSDQGLMTARLWPRAQQSLCEHRLCGYPQTRGAKHSSTEVEHFGTYDGPRLNDVPVEFFDIVDHPLKPRIEEYYKRDPRRKLEMDCHRGDSYANFMGAPEFYTDLALGDFNRWGPPFLRDPELFTI